MKALIFMLLSVFCYSWYPLFSAIIANTNQPFFFTLISHFFALLCSIICVVILISQKVFNVDSLVTVVKDSSFVSSLIVSSLFSIPAHTLILFSMRWVNNTSSTMIYELWPIFTIYILPVILKRKYHRVSIWEITFSMLAFFGVYLLILGKSITTQQLDMSFFALRFDHHSLLGYTLALLGSFSLAINSSYAVKASAILESKYSKTASAIIVQFFLRLFSFTIGLLIIPFYTESISFINLPSFVLIASITGVFIHCIGSILYTLANTHSPSSNINALWYVTPIAAVFWLWIYDLTIITDLVAIGTMFIICANLLTTVKGENNISYISVILWTLFVGTYCYIVGGVKFTDYYNAVSVSSIFYVIVAAFILDRTKTRTETEENIILKIVEKLNNTDSYKKEIFIKIQNILLVTSKDKLFFIYKKLFSENTDDIKELDISFLINQLMISKSKIISFGEKFVLFITGTLTLFTSVYYRNSDFFSDIFSIILSTAVVFTYFNVIDTDMERRKTFIYYENGYIHLSETRFSEKKEDRNMAVILLFSVVIIICYLLYRKHHFFPI